MKRVTKNLLDKPLAKVEAIEQFPPPVFEDGTNWVPNKEQLRMFIRDARPIPVADENGDIPCMRLWPVAQCQWTHAHYGGCATR